MKDELDLLLISAQIDALKVDPNYIGMRTIQKNRLLDAINNFEKDLDYAVYLEIQELTKDVFDIDVPLPKVVFIVYSDPFLHSELVEFGVEDLGSSWFSALSRFFLNCDYPSYGDNLTDEELIAYQNRLKDAIVIYSTN